LGRQSIKAFARRAVQTIGVHGCYCENTALNVFAAQGPIEFKTVVKFSALDSMIYAVLIPPAYRVAVYLSEDGICRAAH